MNSTSLFFSRCFSLMLFLLTIITIPVLSLILNSGHLYAQKIDYAMVLDGVIIHHSDGTQEQDGMIIWRQGIIEYVGKKRTLAKDEYLIPHQWNNKKPLHLYPSFIDGLAQWGSPELPKKVEKSKTPGNPGYERSGIQPQRLPHKIIPKDDKTYSLALKKGFAVAALGLKGYMLPSQVDLMFMDKNMNYEQVMEKGIALVAQLKPAPGSWGAAYPNTIMGVMARFRQLWYDTQSLTSHIEGYQSGLGYSVPKRDEILESIAPFYNRTKPLFFVADSKEDIERINWLENDLKFKWILISGKEAHYQKDYLKKKEISILVSLDLPKKPLWLKEEEKTKDDENKEKKNNTTKKKITEEERLFRQRQKEAYHDAIGNIRKLLDSGIKVGYASYGGKSLQKQDFNDNIRLLLSDGNLKENEILAILTTNTAEILGQENRIGKLKAGYIASFSLFNKPFTEEKSKPVMVISKGNLIMTSEDKHSEKATSK